MSTGSVRMASRFETVAVASLVFTVLTLFFAALLLWLQLRPKG